MNDPCVCAMGHYDGKVTTQGGILFHAVCDKPLACELAYLLPEDAEESCLASVDVGNLDVCAVHAAVAQQMMEKRCAAIETEAGQQLLGDDGCALP